MKRFKTVDEYIAGQEEWSSELKRLREIVNSTQLEETVKWGFPCYTLKGKNVVGLGSFKSYFGVWFFNGVFMKDKAKKLINAQEGRTKGMRQWRMTSPDEIDEKLLLEYLAEAIQNQRDGKIVKPEKKPLVIPDELEEAFSSNVALKKAFEEFNLTKKREFAEHILEAKQDATKQKRLEKVIPMILEKVGLNDKYR